MRVSDLVPFNLMLRTFSLQFSCCRPPAPPLLWSPRSQTFFSSQIGRYLIQKQQYASNITLLYHSPNHSIFLLHVFPLLIDSAIRLRYTFFPTAFVHWRSRVCARINIAEKIRTRHNSRRRKRIKTFQLRNRYGV